MANNGPCDVERCYSPIACAAFGYCRNRNIGKGVPDRATAAKWRREWIATKPEPVCPISGLPERIFSGPTEKE